VPGVLVLTVAATAMGYYYSRVTGSPFRMTYEVNRQTYAMAPYFIFFHLRPEPTYHHAVMRDYYAGWEVQQFREAQTLLGFLRRNIHKVIELWKFYIAPVFSMPLLALPWVWRSRKMRMPLIAGGVFCLGLLIQTWTFPHYVAPATGLFYLVLIQCVRYLNLWRRNGLAVGRTLVRTIPLICVGMLALRISALATHTVLEPRWPQGNLDLPKVQERLNHIPGKHLVIVRYGPLHNVDRDWVYNEPEIDSSRIVWARDMGDTNNRELLQYFRDRKAWLMQGDDSPPQVSPYVPKEDF
jgi:hypothetical protein